MRDITLRLVSDEKVLYEANGEIRDDYTSSQTQVCWSSTSGIFKQWPVIPTNLTEAYVRMEIMASNKCGDKPYEIIMRKRL